jgi:hypothetical protein
MSDSRVVIWIVALVMTSGASLAHHSFASIDMSKMVQLEGTVRKFQWTNPHVWIWLDVRGKGGKITTYGLEGVSVGELARNGWTRRSLNTGDKIKVAMHPFRSQKPGGAFESLEFEDGRKLSQPRPPAGVGPPPGPPAR